MQTLRILFFLLVVLIGVIVLKEFVFNGANSSQKNQSMIGDGQPTPTAGIKTHLKKAETLHKASPALSPTSIPPTAKPTAIPQTSSSLNAYRYPNASVTSQSQNEIDMTTTDDAQVVTDWYKNTISTQGLHTTSFVQTSTNGDILNKLAAGLSGGGQITITISKSASANTVSISAVISHS